MTLNPTEVARCIDEMQAVVDRYPKPVVREVMWLFFESFTDAEERELQEEAPEQFVTVDVDVSVPKTADRVVDTTERVYSPEDKMRAAAQWDERPRMQKRGAASPVVLKTVEHLRENSPRTIRELAMWAGVTVQGMRARLNAGIADGLIEALGDAEGRYRATAKAEEHAA